MKKQILLFSIITVTFFIVSCSDNNLNLTNPRSSNIEISKQRGSHVFNLFCRPDQTMFRWSFDVNNPPPSVDPIQGLAVAGGTHTPSRAEYFGIWCVSHNGQIWNLKTGSGWVKKHGCYAKDITSSPHNNVYAINIDDNKIFR